MDVVTRADDNRLNDALDGINTLVRTHRPMLGFGSTASPRPSSRPRRASSWTCPGRPRRSSGTWVTGLPVRLPLLQIEPAAGVSPAVVQQTIVDLAGPSVASPVQVLGNGRQASLSPQIIASALSFTPDGAGGLKPVLDIPKLADAVRPELVMTEQPAKDASVRLSGGTPVVTPSLNGHGIDYPATFAGLVQVLKRPANRSVIAVYADQPPSSPPSRSTRSASRVRSARSAQVGSHRTPGRTSSGPPRRSTQDLDAG